MKSLFLMLAFSFSFSIFADCTIAVGGPGVPFDSVVSLNSEINYKLTAAGMNRGRSYAVSSLGEAMNLDADYMAYLVLTPYSVELQFRDILLNGILYSRTYSSGLGASGAIKAMAQDFEKNVLPKIQKYCK